MSTVFSNPPESRSACSWWEAASPQHRGIIAKAAHCHPRTCGDSWATLGGDTQLRLNHAICSICKLGQLDAGEFFLFADREAAPMRYHGNSWYGRPYSGGPWTEDRETLVVPYVLTEDEAEAWDDE